MSRTIGSILHGAYGDYYEQSVCLKDFQLKHPDTKLKLFAASPNRLAELGVLDFSWAGCFELWTELPKHDLDEFFQFQVNDTSLQNEVLSKLPSDVLRKIDLEHNQLPWRYLRSILPLEPRQQLALDDQGRSSLSRIMQENGIGAKAFQKPTIGFLWRYRAAGGAVKSVFLPEAKRLVAKYSRLFRRLIDEFGCHVMICGMKVPRTPENMHRIDAKYPEYGLDLPPESSTHLKGLSWALELEILARCTLCVVNPSGFSEALWIKRGKGMVLVDPPPHYLAKALWHRVSLFNLQRPGSLLSAVASRWEQAALAQIRSEFERALRQAHSPAVTEWQSTI